MTGNLFAIEGPDGAGKSTLVKTLWEIARDEFIFTKEPYYKMYTDIIKSREVTPFERALLFSADRYKHINEVLSQIYADQNIITDRYYMSNLVYQTLEMAHTAADQERAYSWLLNIQPLNLIKPTHTYIILAEPSEMYTRMCRRVEGATHTIDQLEELSLYYQMIAERICPGKYTFVYSDQLSIFDMATNVYDHIKTLI